MNDGSMLRMMGVDTVLHRIVHRKDVPFIRRVSLITPVGFADSPHDASAFTIFVIMQSPRAAAGPVGHPRLSHVTSGRSFIPPTAPASSPRCARARTRGSPRCTHPSIHWGHSSWVSVGIAVVPELPAIRRRPGDRMANVPGPSMRLRWQGVGNGACIQPAGGVDKPWAAGSASAMAKKDTRGLLFSMKWTYNIHGEYPRGA